MSDTMKLGIGIVIGFAVLVVFAVIVYRAGYANGYNSAVRDFDPSYRAAVKE